MLRKTERLPIEKIEAKVLQFGPLTNAQISTMFGLTLKSSVAARIRQQSTKLKYHNIDKHRKIWYHVDGRKPEGCVE